MKIGIVGSRRRDSKHDFELVFNKLLDLVMSKEALGQDVFIVSGGCSSGADRFAEDIAKDYGLDIIIHKAGWAKHGKSAGPVRNTMIAQDSDILIACVAEDRTGGTEDTIRKFVKLKGEKNLHIV